MRPDRAFHLRWTLAHGAAEAVGIGVAAAGVVGFLAIAGEPASPGGRLALIATVCVLALVEGSALAAAQIALLRGRIPSLPRLHWWATTVALAVAGWVMGTLPALAPSDASGFDPSLATVLGLSAVLGAGSGVVFGTGQWLVLRHHARSAARWIPANAAGWTLGMAAIFAGASLPQADTSTPGILASAVAGGLLGGVGLVWATGFLARRLDPWVHPAWRMDGSVCVVTGGTSGIGFQTAVGLTRQGATVVLPVRDLGRGAVAVRAIRKRAGDGALHLVHCDLASLDSVRRAGAEIAERWPQLAAIVHDAGVYPQVRTPTVDGFELGLAVHVIGPHLLNRLLAPHLGDHARIVQLAGASHRHGALDPQDLRGHDTIFEPGAANARSQLARVLMMRGLARRLAPRGITVNAVHPGAVLTPAQAPLPTWVRFLIHGPLRPGFVRASLGATPVVRLVVDPALALVTGTFFRRFEAGEAAANTVDDTAVEALFEALDRAVDPDSAVAEAS